MDDFVHQRTHISVLQQRILFAESRFSEPVYLVENFPEWPPHAFDEAVGTQSAHSARQYLPSRGSDQLIEQIISHERVKYGTKFPQESILVTAGGMHALWLAFRHIATRRPGSTVLCVGTTFVGVVNLIRLSGMNVRFVILNPSDLTVESIERHCTDDVSCVYINSPHNPTGEYLDGQMMRRLAQWAENRSLSCVIDAVYDSFFFDGGSPELPAGTGVADHIYFVCSMSKNFGLPGARIGWLISSARNVRAAVSWLENENVSVSSVSQGLAARVLASGNSALIASVTAVRRRALELLTRTFGVRRLPPAGTQMLLKLPVPDVEHFADYALNRHALVLATSSNYAGFREEFVRLPFSYRVERTEISLQMLELALSTYPALKVSA